MHTHLRVPRFIILLVGLSATIQVSARPPDEAAVTRLAPWFSSAVFYDPKLSPTGEYLAFILRERDSYALGIFEFATGKLSYAGGSNKILPLEFWWKGPRRLMVRVTSDTGRRQGMSSFDIDGKNPEELWKLQEAGGNIIDSLPSDPNHVLLAYSNEVVRFDLKSGKSTKILDGIGHVNDWFLDIKGQIRAGSIRRFDGSRILWWRPTSGGEWRSYKMTPEDRGIRAIAFDSDPRYLWVWDFRTPPSIHLARFDTMDGSIHPAIGGGALDPTHVLSVGTFRHPVAAVYSQTQPVRLESMDESRRQAVELLQKRFTGYFPMIVDSLPDGRNWVVWAGNSRFPGGFFLFDYQTGKTALIATSGDPALKESLFVSSTTISADSRHGVKLTGRLWLPPGITKPPVIVICPSSLPAMPATDLFNPLIQAYVANGYAVAKFDGRSTIGYGRDTDLLGQGSVAQSLHEDLEDGVNALASQGLIDNQRAVLFGTGMAGAIALSVAEIGSFFRAVVSVNAPLEVDRDDLLSLSEDSSQNMLASRLGGWRQSARIAKALSPIEVAPRVRVSALHLADEAEAQTGKLPDGARRLQRALKSASAPARVEVAYSWVDGFNPPSFIARDRATVALRIVDFYNEVLATPKSP
jgi:dipeptidyl aminopeptidase/acylaminoacyl peptidase